MLFITLLTYISPIAGFFVLIPVLLANRRYPYTANLKKLAVAFAFIFASFGYSMSIPEGNFDLLFYYNQIESFANQDLVTIMHFDREKLYTRDILFYFVGKTGNVRVLPWIVGFFVYLMVFYVVFDRVERSNKEFTVGDILKIIVITVGIVSPYSIIGNTRCVFAYVIISFAVYRELIQHKKNIITIILYLIPIWLHTSAIAIIFIRLLQLFVKPLGKWVLVVALFIPMTITVVNTYIDILAGNFAGDILVAAVHKAYSYLNWTEGGWATLVQTSLYNKVQRIYGTLFIIGIIVMIIVAQYKLKNSRKVFETPMFGYIYLIAVCALGTLVITTGVFWRLEAVVVLFSVIIFVPLLEVEFKYVDVIFNILFYSAIIMLGVNMVHQIRNLEVVPTVMNMIKVNGFTVTYELLRGLIMK